MKNFKKILALMICAAMIFALAACGSSSSDTSSGSSSDDTEESASLTAEEGVIVFGTNAEFPPFEYVSTSDGLIGEYDGIDIAIAAAIGEALGLEVEINNMEFDSLLVALENGQVDAVIAGMTVTDERLEEVNFSTSYYAATQVMIVPEDSDITCAADMEGKTIAVIQGYTGEIAVQELGFDYESFKKGTDAILELVNGKADVVVIDSATAAKYIEDNEGLMIVEDEDTFGNEEYAIAVNKENEELLEAINEIIEELLADGTIADLGDEYSVTEE